MRDVGHILPARFAPTDFYSEIAQMGAAGGFTAATWPAANRAIYTPIVFPADCSIFEIMALGANATGNYDLGLYGPEFNRLTNKGSTAMAAALLTHTFSDIRVKGGLTYYLGMALSSASGSVGRLSAGATIRLLTVGVGQEAGALPLPTTMTPVAPANDYLPWMTVGVR